MKAVRKAAEHPVSVLMVYSALLVFGMLSFTRLDLELLPTLPVPIATVIAEYPGIPAEELESLVTIPLENVLSSVKGVREINSVSKDELSAVTLCFNWGVKLDRATVEIRERVDTVFPFLPYGVRKPSVFTYDANDQPVLVVAAVPASGVALRDITELISEELATKLRQVPGVAYLRIVGLQEPEVRVDVDGQKLGAAGLPLMAVVRALDSSIYQAPVGTVFEDGREYLVEATTNVDTLEAIRRIPLPGGQDGSLVHLDEFARVYMGTKARRSFFHYNGREAVGIFFMKTAEAGSLNTARNIRKTLAALSSGLKNELQLSVVDDPTLEIALGIRNLVAAIGLGILSAFGVLYFLYRRFKVSVIIAASIPASMTLVFLFMHFANISLNIISLTGIAIGIGMIVDNSIVVLESMLHRGAKNPNQIARAVKSSTGAIFASTVTTLSVFLPIVFVPGITGALFRDLALTVSCLTLASFFCALSLTPALYSLLLSGRLEATNKSVVSPTEKLKPLYARYLGAALRVPGLMVAALLLLSAVGALAWLKLPKKILPDMQTQQLIGSVRYAPGSKLEECLADSLEIAGELVDLDCVGSVFTEAGSDDDSLFDRSKQKSGHNNVRFHIMLSDLRRAGGKEDFTDIARVFDLHSFENHSLSQPLDSISRLLGTTDIMSFRFSGYDRSVLVERALRVKEHLEASGLARTATVDTKEDLPRVDLHLDPQILAGRRISPAGALASLRTAIRGDDRVSIKNSGKRIDIRVRLRPSETDSIDEIEKVQVGYGEGLIQAGLIGRFSQRRAFSELYRYNRKAAVTLSIRGIADKKAALAAKLSSLAGDRGELLEHSKLEQSRQHITTVFLFALLLLYLVLGAQFESVLLPLLLLAGLAPAVTGSLLALLVCHYSLNINSFLGLLILLGTAINISIVLMTSYRTVIPIQAVDLVRISEMRLRPIISTTLTTVIAMVPIAVATFQKAVMQSNTAVVLIGGLVTGSISILLIFPVLYYYLCRLAFGKQAR